HLHVKISLHLFMNESKCIGLLPDGVATAANLNRSGIPRKTKALLRRFTDIGHGPSKFIYRKGQLPKGIARGVLEMSDRNIGAFQRVIQMEHHSLAAFSQ